VRPRESVAVHTTWVVPPGNRDPETGEQDRFTGGVPPFGIGDPNVTDTGSPSGDCPSTAAGHVNVNRFGGGGAVGLDPHAARIITIVNDAAIGATHALKYFINATYPRATRRRHLRCDRRGRRHLRPLHRARADPARPVGRAPRTPRLRRRHVLQQPENRPRRHPPAPARRDRRGPPVRPRAP